MKKPIKHFALMGALVFSTTVYGQSEDVSQTPPPNEEQVEEAVAEEEVAVDDDFFDFSLEDLMNVEITSVSKKAEKLQSVAASIYVLSAEDIASSGATNLHEALRNVPGYWGVQDEYSSVEPVIRNSPSENGSRGTMLVLLDGTPMQDNMASTFSFKNFDIPLDEIDRIEVIRGSGGTVYGANSATGVINIFTKNPEKYDGISARAEYALPGYTAVSVRAGGKVTEDLSVSGYAKARSFSGYGTKSEFDGDSVWVPNNSGEGSTYIKNDFTEDFESTQMYSGGLKAVYKVSDDTKVSLNTHMNLAKQTEYTNYETDQVLLEPFTGVTAKDAIVENDVTRSRVVGNVKVDHNFNENHSVFARVSTNMENDFLKILGGYKVNNSIYDLEIQDNISIGKMNDLSIGANYRQVNFNVHDVNDVDGLRYLDPKSSENLKGFFLQDKVKLFDGKLNFLLGVKAENYSLINDEYYLSPMAKISVVPNDNFTFWTGFTQSYTTPGYNNTNIDLFLLKAAPSAQFDPIADQLAYQGVYQSIYDSVYQVAKGQGAPDNVAEQSAAGAANGFLSSPAGQGTVAGVADGIKTNNTAAGVINGSKTVPTKYQTVEAGFRLSAENKVSFESNAYYSIVTDAISASEDSIYGGYNSPTRDGVKANYYLYGNYVKGAIYGVESMVKIVPVKGTTIEFSHVYTESNWEYQENDDFEISKESGFNQDKIDRTPKDPVMPKHVLRMRSSFELPKNFRFNVGLVYASKFSSEARYNFEEQRHPSVLKSNVGTVVAENNSRTIVNLKLERNMLDDNLNVYIFANDIFNEGMVASTTILSNTTLSNIGAMVGVGANYKF